MRGTAKALMSMAVISKGADGLCVELISKGKVAHRAAPTSKGDAKHSPAKAQYCYTL